MKYFYITFIIIVFLPASSFAQIDTTSLSYYPLNDGDYWEYEELIEQLPPLLPGTTYHYYSIKIIGDTTPANLKKYKILEINHDGLILNRYERIDTLNYNVFRYLHSVPGNEYLIDSLRAESGDTLRASRTGYISSQKGSVCFNTSTDSILGRITTIKKFKQLFPSFAAYIHHLSAGFGFCYLERYGMYEKYVSELKYAKINGVEYGSPVITGIDPIDNQTKTFRLIQNYPNPFNPTTNIQFSIPKSEHVTLKIYNLKGQEVTTLVSGKLNAGIHNYTWDASGFASGVYIISLQSKTKSQVKKCLLIK